MQGLVSNHFRIETMSRTAGQKPVLRITLKQSRGNYRALSIGMARKNTLDESLDVPIVLNEAQGEPIKKFWMARQFALGSKIGARCDQARPEANVRKQGSVLKPVPARKSGSKAM